MPEYLRSASASLLGGSVRRHTFDFASARPPRSAHQPTAWQAATSGRDAPRSLGSAALARLAERMAGRMAVSQTQMAAAATNLATASAAASSGAAHSAAPAPLVCI